MRKTKLVISAAFHLATLAGPTTAGPIAGPIAGPSSVVEQEGRGCRRRNDSSSSDEQSIFTKLACAKKLKKRFQVDVSETESDWLHINGEPNWPLDTISQLSRFLNDAYVKAATTAILARNLTERWAERRVQ